MFFDIHSHLLPCVDDGSGSLEESLALLKALKEQGVTALALTPHFYPSQQSFEEFFEDVSVAFEQLKNAIAKEEELPELFLGCELLYCRGVLGSDLIRRFCISNSDYLLLELTEFDIDEHLFDEIINLKNSGIIPIIAHPERYYRSKNYHKFLKFIEKENLIIQLNAPSFLHKKYKGALKKLLKLPVPVLLASDTHSVSRRPPLISEALTMMIDMLGRGRCKKILEASNLIYRTITSKQ